MTLTTCNNKGVLSFKIPKKEYKIYYHVYVDNILWFHPESDKEVHWTKLTLVGKSLVK